MNTTNKDKKQLEWNFPCLGQIRSIDVVVLFCEEEMGTIVHSTEEEYETGYYCEMWVMKDFDLYDGEITLSND